MQRAWSSPATGECRLELVVGDVAAQDTDAIANAANAMLMGGGGVDGAIHRAAGPELLDACREIKRKLAGGVLPAGGAMITPGFQLAAKHVIHCVGPIFEREGAAAPALLARCYREALRLAREHGLASISFPSISTGVYGYPVAEAAGVALDAVLAELREHRRPALVRFALFDAGVFEAYATAAAARIDGA